MIFSFGENFVSYANASDTCEELYKIIVKKSEELKNLTSENDRLEIEKSVLYCVIPILFGVFVGLPFWKFLERNKQQ